MEKQAIDNLKKIVDNLGKIVRTCYDAFKDGVQYRDAKIIPPLFVIIVVIAKSFPKAIIEAKDLSFEEIAELGGELVETFIDIFDNDDTK